MMEPADGEQRNTLVEMYPVTVILLGGLPASGKSTLARRLIQVYGNRAIHLEYDEFEDAIVEENTEGGHLEAWNQARQLSITQLEHRLQDCAWRAKGGKIILMDDNFHLRGMRKEIHRLLLGHKSVNFGVLWLSTPLLTCLDRNQQRSRQIPSKVFDKMAHAMEPPRAVWEQCWLEVFPDTSFEEVLDFVETCASVVDLPEAPVNIEQQEADRQATLQSESHHIDMLLRAWVGKVAKYDKSLARCANEARKCTIKTVKDREDYSLLPKSKLLSMFLDTLLDGKDPATYSSLQMDLGSTD